MRDVLVNIRSRLQQGLYQNEEHVRMCVVCRLLAELGWDIWNPQEVNAEFAPVPTEDKTKVDLALFLRPGVPSVFFEIKGVGRITSLEETERQVRDYNRNNAAEFCVITDARVWRFYYSLTPGEFHTKWFRTLDLSKDDPEEIERGLVELLSKNAISAGTAKDRAGELLRLTRKQQMMAQLLRGAQKRALEPPFPNLPDALVELMVQQGFAISREEAVGFIAEAGKVPLPQPPSPPRPDPEINPSPMPGEFDPDRPPDLRHTSVLDARIGSEAAGSWNALVSAGIKIACSRGHPFSTVRGWLDGGLEQGRRTDSAFQPVPGTNWSHQNAESSRAWRKALRLAKELRLELHVRFRWSSKEKAAHPGLEGRMRWSPGSTS